MSVPADTSERSPALDRLIAQEPGPDDGGAAWFEARLASKLEKAKLKTLADVAERINGVGARWRTVVPGVGAIKAERVVGWLGLHQGSTGPVLGGHVAVPRSQLRQPSVSKPRTTTRQLQPGWPRSTTRTAPERRRRTAHTAILEQGKPLSSLTVEDVNALQVVPGRAAAALVRTAASAALVAALAAARRTARAGGAPAVDRYSAEPLYFPGQPELPDRQCAAGVALPRETGWVLGSRRTLTFDQWDAIEERLEAIGHDAHGRRRARAVRWLCATGLRLSEMANAQCGDLREVDYWLPEGKMDTGWLLSDKLREVPVPASLVEELQKELGRHGLELDVQAESNQDISILVRFEDVHARPWSMSGLAKGIKTLLTDIATDLEPDDAKQLREASTHWLRHSHGSHALNGRPAEAGVPIQVVQNNLGHASIGTTSGYLSTERDMRLAAMKGFGAKVPP